MNDYALSLDIGSSQVRAAAVYKDGSLGKVVTAAFSQEAPAPGFAELDAEAVFQAATEVCEQLMKEAGAPACMGISCQRATTVVFDRSGRPLAPALGWQDLRTLDLCLELRQKGIRTSPNASLTKVMYLLKSLKEKASEALAGTLDSFVIYRLTKGAIHATDTSQAGATTMFSVKDLDWASEVLQAAAIPHEVLPRIVPSIGFIEAASALSHSPPVTASLGDQQASLLGQGGLKAGIAKITFGTGAMLDLSLGPEQAPFDFFGPHGTFPIVAFSTSQEVFFGLEAMMISAGSVIRWLKDKLGLIGDYSEIDEIAGQRQADLIFIPAQFGLGTPYWDFGARSAFFGLSRSTTRGQMVRAVLEGIAHRARDLVESAEADSGKTITEVRVDGGLIRSKLFLEALADALERPIFPFRHVEASVYGAGLAALIGAGVMDRERAIEVSKPKQAISPERRLDRELYLKALERVKRTIPELSELKLF